MAKCLPILITVFVVCFVNKSIAKTLAEPQHQLGDEVQWRAWKKMYNKIYENEFVEKYRKAIWQANLQKIVEHNKAGHTFTLGMNQMGDLTPIEYRHLMLGARYPSKETKPGGSTFLPPSNVKLPAEVDWRKEGYVTPVKNQGDCGSSWAFSSTGSLEGQHFNKTGQLVSLSEQNLVDCTGPYGNQGCSGGWMDNAFKYIKANGGIDTEASYPYYAGELGHCYFRPDSVGATVSGYTDIAEGSESDLQVAVATVGPVSVAIDASYLSFHVYRSGIYNEPACGSSKFDLDHAVLVVGYGTMDGQDYWLVKNSWNTSWGMEGYIMMSRNRNNQCGIATAASYPMV